MSKKNLKKVLSGVMAVAMSASALMTGVTSLTAFAAAGGEELGMVDFNQGAGLPWHICESATGTMKFEIADGCYNILITNPGGTNNDGEGRWDCQFRHRGLTLESNHTYRLTYSVWTDDSDARIYAKIGDMTDDDKELWHGNGKVLNLKYSDVEGKDQAAIEAALASASAGQEIAYGEGWDNWKNSRLPANQWTTYAYEFQPDSSASGVGEWTFHLGGESPYNDFTCVHEGKIIKFDNMALIDLTNDDSNYVAEDAYVPTGIEVNQVGYYPLLTKKATLVLGDTPDGTSKPWELKNSSGQTVASGNTTGGTTLEKASNTYNQIIDFSDYQEIGTGYTITCDGKTSLPFDIGNDIYGNLTSEAMNYFYQNRSGVDIKASFIVSANDQGPKASASDLARPAGHSKDEAYVQSKWVYIIPNADAVEKGKTMDVTGGWYDAGDHGKYVVNGGVSLWTLLSLYERDAAKGDISKWEDGSGTVTVPEVGNSIPDILDECKVETDFFMKMQDTDGMVYHKIHDYKWTALAVSPADATERTQDSEDPLLRIIKPKTYAATLNAAAALAQYSRLVAPFDAAEASKTLDAAKKAYDAAKKSYKPYETVADELKDHESLYAPLAQNKGGGPYGDTCVTDEFYWAACELYITTGDKSYYTDLMSYDDASGKALSVPTALYGGENNGSCGSFTWGTVGSLGTMSLSINADYMAEKGLLTADEIKDVQNSVKNAADYFLKVEEESDFGVPYVGHDYEITVWTLAGGEQKKTLENGYEWGSNSFVINNAMVMSLAYDIDHEIQYINGVSTAFDYILGRNVTEQSYVTAYGEHATQYPHHRWWSWQLDNSFPSAPKAVMSGGPNSEMQDPMIQGKGYKAGEIAPMLCYLDNLEAWSVNECTINWNSPLVWISSFLEDEAPNADGTVGTKPNTTTQPVDITTDPTDPTKVLLGDVDLDGRVTLSDVVVLNKALSGNVNTALNTAQKANASCFDDGIIDGKDASTILQFIAGIVKKMPIK